MRCTLACLLLLAAAVAALPGAAALDAHLVEARWDFTPEDWTIDPPHPDHFEARSRLGIHLETLLEVRRGGDPLPTDWSLEASLHDGNTTVQGRVERSGADTVAVRFDVDGARDRSALAPSHWRLDLRAVDGDGSPAGTARIHVSAVAVDARLHHGFQDGPPVAGVAAPHGSVPGFAAVGSGVAAWLPLDPLDPDAHHHVAVRTGLPHARVALVAYTAAAPILDVPGTPTEGVLAQWTRHELRSTATDAHGDARFPLDPATWRRLFEGPGGVAALAVTVEGDATGGGTSLLVAAAPHTPRFAAVEPPEAGGSGLVRYLIADAPGLGGPAGLPVDLPARAGPLWLARLGHDPEAPGAVLATGVMAPRADGGWDGVVDAAALRGAGVPGYGALVFFRDAQGAYVAHAGLLRGVSAELEAHGLAAGKEGTVRIHLENLHGAPASSPGLAVRGTAVLRIGTEEAARVHVIVPDGGRLHREVPVVPEATGHRVLSLEVDSGDLHFTMSQEVEVQDPERAGAWPIPGPAAVAAIAAALLLARGSKNAGRKR